MNAYYATALSLEPEEQIPMNDLELKDILAKLEVLHKIVDELVDEVLNGISERVFKENQQTFV